MTSSGAAFSGLARNLRQIGRSPATWGWVLGVLLIQAIVDFVGGPNQEPAWTWFEWLGLRRVEFLEGGIWKLGTYGFLHGHWPHAGCNALLILLIGFRIEYIAGAVAVSKALAAGILGGGAVHLVLAPGGTESPLLVGISGGCVGLLLLLTTLSPQSRMMPLPVSGRSLGAGVLIAEFLMALMDPALGVPGFAGIGKSLVAQGMGGLFTVGHACHLGGGLAGWLMGRWMLRPRVTLESLRAERKRREARGVERAG